jgi:hypothetical protein
MKIPIHLFKPRDENRRDRRRVVSEQVRVTLRRNSVWRAWPRTRTGRRWGVKEYIEKTEDVETSGDGGVAWIEV